MKHTDWVPGVSKHFVARAMERMGCTEDEARTLGQGLIWAFENERWDLLEYVSRLNRTGNRLFRFCWTPTKRKWYAVVNTDERVCVTVLAPGFTVKRAGKDRIVLMKEDDL